MTKDEQARARLVEIALEVARKPDQMVQALADPFTLRQRAGMKDPKRGHWCAAGLTAAMDIAGLVVPAPGTPARRGAVALLEFVYESQNGHVVARTNGSPAMAQICMGSGVWSRTQPGDIIAWLQNKSPAQWLLEGATLHAYATNISGTSMCGKSWRRASTHLLTQGKRCSSCVWETRKGHVALIVAVDDESITTVGWNEGNAPGRVMKRRLWRDPERREQYKGDGEWRGSTFTRRVPRSSTVLYRRPGGLYGIARPVAR